MLVALLAVGAHSSVALAGAGNGTGAAVNESSTGTGDSTDEAGNGSGESVDENEQGTGDSTDEAGNGSGESVDENEGGTGDSTDEASTGSGAFTDVAACMPELLCGATPNAVLCQVFPIPEDDVGILWKDDGVPHSVGNAFETFSCAGVDEVEVEVHLFYSGDRELILRQTVDCL